MKVSLTNALLLSLTMAGCGKATIRHPPADMGNNDLVVADLSSPDLLSHMDAANPACTVGVACTNASTGGNGVCNNGACDVCTQDSDCLTTYGAGTICLTGVCQHGCDTPTGTVGCTGGQVCVNNSCQTCTNDSQCPSGDVCATASPAPVCVANTCSNPGSSCNATNPGDQCCAGANGNACVAGNCCGTGACTAPGVASGMCVNNNCVAAGCPSPSPGLRFVSPTASPGGNGSVTCPYTNLDNPISDLKTVGNAEIIVLGGTTTTLTDSAILPATVTITGADSSFNPCTPTTGLTTGSCASPSAWPTITVPSSSTFSPFTGGGTLSYLQIVAPTSYSTPASAIYVQGATVNLSHLRVSGFWAGVWLNSASPTVNINGDVWLNNNVYFGLLASAGTVHINNLTSLSANEFNANGIASTPRAGIWVQGAATLDVGATGATGAATTASNNIGYGFYSSSTGACSLTSLTADANTLPGIYAAGTGALTLLDVIVDQNNAKGVASGAGVQNSGGIVLASPGPTTAAFTSIAAESNTGNGLALNGTGSFTIKNSIVYGNTYDGVLMVTNGGSLTTTGSLFSHNGANGVEIQTGAVTDATTIGSQINFGTATEGHTGQGANTFTTNTAAGFCLGGGLTGLNSTNRADLINAQGNTWNAGVCSASVTLVAAANCAPSGATVDISANCQGQIGAASCNVGAVSCN